MLISTNGKNLNIAFESNMDCKVLLNLLHAAGGQALREVKVGEHNIRDCLYMLENYGDVWEESEDYCVSERLEQAENKIKKNKNIIMIKNKLMTAFYDIDIQFNKGSEEN